MSDSTFTGNTAADSGGGLYNLDTVRLDDCGLSGNSAGSGDGGVFNGTGAELTVNNSTVTSNSVPTGADPDDLGSSRPNHSTIGVISHWCPPWPRQGAAIRVSDSRRPIRAGIATPPR